MGNVDSVPVVSQTKSLVQAISGDTEGARQTQENFSRQCPVVSQTRSLVEVSMGDTDAAAETQKQFVQGMSDFADRQPVIGHIKGGIHYACGDREGGDKAMMNATRGVAGIYGMFSSAHTSKETSTTVGINTRIAKEFNGVDLKEWAQALDSEMAVACHEIVKSLNQRKMTRGANLTWDDVVYVFNNSYFVNQDQTKSKRIRDSLEWDETNFFKFDGSPDEIRKREITNWISNLMTRNGEKDVYDNAAIFNKNTLDRLASIASQSGATVKDPASLFGASESQKEKVLEISVIRFPEKWNSKIKIYRIIIFSWFKCTRVLFGQHDKTGFEIEYDSSEYKPNTAAIDNQQAAKAKTELSKPHMFDF